jgi:hypothetical protein
VDENLTSFLEVQDASIRDLLALGEEIFDGAENFSMGGNLDPDADGYLGNTNSLIFNSVTWQWEGNERTIDLRNEDFIRGENIKASVVFHPDPDSSEVYSLAMDPLFKLSLNYGETLFWVFEGVVLPELLGSSIGSFQDFATHLMDCELLSRRLLCEDPYSNDPDCNPAVGFAVDGIVAGCGIMQGGNTEPISPLVSSLLAGKETCI